MNRDLLVVGAAALLGVVAGGCASTGGATASWRGGGEGHAERGASGGGPSTKPAASAPGTFDEAVERAAVGRVLDEFHAAAARADEAKYFGLLAENAVFLGTDDWERWPKREFREWARDKFEGESAWVYVAQVRHMDFSARGDVAWFDETVVNEKYGALRGTGVLVRQGVGWRIAQYNLTFTVPNEIAPRVVEMIREFDAQPTAEGAH